MALQPKSGPGLPFWNFVTKTFLQGWIVSPAPNPQPGGPGLGIYDPRGTGWPSYTLRHWVPILEALYDMRGLQWDYSVIPATTRDTQRICQTTERLTSVIMWDTYSSWKVWPSRDFIFSEPTVGHLAGLKERGRATRRKVSIYSGQ
jgi:hypothetical protein